MVRLFRTPLAWILINLFIFSVRALLRCYMGQDGELAGYSLTIRTTTTQQFNFLHSVLSEH